MYGQQVLTFTDFAYLGMACFYVPKYTFENGKNTRNAIFCNPKDYPKSLNAKLEGELINLLH